MKIPNTRHRSLLLNYQLAKVVQETPETLQVIAVILVLPPRGGKKVPIAEYEAHCQILGPE